MFGFKENMKGTKKRYTHLVKMVIKHDGFEDDIAIPIYDSRNEISRIIDNNFELRRYSYYDSIYQQIRRFLIKYDLWLLPPMIKDDGKLYLYQGDTQYIYMIKEFK